MPSINMIAPRRAEKKRLERNTRKLLTVITVEVALILGIVGLLISRTYGTGLMIKDMEVQLTKLQPTVRKIESFDEASQALRPKLDTLNAAQDETLRWSRILDQISTSLPQKTWLTRLASTPPQPAAKEIMVSMNGISESQEQVGETMLRIHDNVSDFSRLDLHYTQRSLVSNASAYEFEIAAAVQLPKEEKKDREVEKS